MKVVIPITFYLVLFIYIDISDSCVCDGGVLFLISQVNAILHNSQFTINN